MRSSTPSHSFPWVGNAFAGVRGQSELHREADGPDAGIARGADRQSPGGEAWRDACIGRGSRQLLFFEIVTELTLSSVCLGC